MKLTPSDDPSFYTKSEGKTFCFSCRESERARETLLFINVSPKLGRLHQILNASPVYFFARESLSAERRHLSSHLVGFSWLSRECAVTIDRHAKIKLWYEVMYACVSSSPFFFFFFFLGHEAHSAISLGRAPNQGGIAISIWSPLSGDNLNLYLRRSAASYP